MGGKKATINPVIILPIVFAIVVIATILFAFFYKGGGMPLTGMQPTPAPTEQAAPTPTPAPQAQRMFAFKLNGKWGYKDQLGEQRIEAKYEKALEFSEGLAFVAVDSAGALKYGVIDDKGAEVLAPQYADARPFAGGYAPVKLGDRWGYINKTGTWIAEPQYTSAGDFSQGLARVSKDGKFGYIDDSGSGNFVLPNMYQEAQDFSDGMAVVGVKDAGGIMSYSLIDITSKQIVASLGRSIGTKFSEGFMAVRQADKKYSFVNKQTVNAFGDKTFEAALNFTEGYAAVKQGGKWGYISKTNGEIFIEPKFEEAREFSEGLAAVKLDGKWGYIDLTKVAVIPNRFDEAGPFKDGYAEVRQGSNIMSLGKDNTTKQLYLLDESAAGGDVAPDAKLMGKVKITSGALNVREKADQNSTLVMKLANAKEVSVLAQEGDWVQIEADGKKGYCLSKFIEVL